MTARAGSAMRLASSWMVITSGIVTSRTSFSFGSADHLLLAPLIAALEGGDGMLRLFVGLEGGDDREPSARLLLLRGARVGLGASTGRPAPGRRGRGASSSSSGATTGRTPGLAVVVVTSSPPRRFLATSSALCLTSSS